MMKTITRKKSLVVAGEGLPISNRPPHPVAAVVAVAMTTKRKMNSMSHLRHRSVDGAPMTLARLFVIFTVLFAN